MDAQGVHQASLVSRMLVSYVLGVPDIELFTDLDRPATAEDRAALRTLVARAAAQEPVQYLVGRADFFGRSYRVNRSTLIPRTASESLVQIVLDWIRGAAGQGQGIPPFRVADVGTGTGCLAISVARQLPALSVVATDLVEDALSLAETNAREHGVADQMEFCPGDGLAALVGRPAFDVVMANLPYISDRVWSELDPNVRDYEPASALRGGPDGLSIIAPLVKSIRSVLRPGGLLALEVDPAQGDAVSMLIREVPDIRQVDILPDEFGDFRIIRAS